MRGIKPLVVLGLTVAFGGLSLGAMTVEEVIAKHVEARGGDRWDSIQTMKITGSYTAFSETNAFTLHRKRGNKYRVDGNRVGSDLTIGFDGETAWYLSDDSRETIEDLDKAMLMREVDFATPFFDYKERGFEVKLLGQVDFEGVEAIGIELKRPDESTETWYLDPQSYLELGLVSPGNDWLGPVERRTYYDDFREVDGVMVPFFTEAQWYTRHRIMAVDKIETNVDVDDDLFRMPLPPGMDLLGSLAGSWNVALSTRRQPDAEWQDSERTSTIEALINGGMLQESYRTPSGVEVLRTYSYDRFNERYRITQIDSHRNQMNVQEGAFDGNGKLLASNVETGTSFIGGEGTFHGRLSIFDITDGGFKVEYETSTDGGESWFLSAKATYSRSDDE